MVIRWYQTYINAALAHRTVLLSFILHRLTISARRHLYISYRANVSAIAPTAARVLVKFNSRINVAYLGNTYDRRISDIATSASVRVLGPKNIPCNSLLRPVDWFKYTNTSTVEKVAISIIRAFDGRALHYRWLTNLLIACTCGMWLCTQSKTFRKK